MSNYSRGSARERQVLERLQQNGWVVTKSGGSKGAGGYDLHCSKAGYPTRLVQVKGTKAGPFSDFGPAKRRELLACAERAGAEAVLCWYPPDRQGPRWLPPEGWPGS